MDQHCDSRGAVDDGAERGQGQFFYRFDLDKVVPTDHLVRQIDGVLDLDWVHKELAPYYSHMGPPSIDPVLLIRMLLAWRACSASKLMRDELARSFRR